MVINVGLYCRGKDDQSIRKQENRLRAEIKMKNNEFKKSNLCVKYEIYRSYLDNNGANDSSRKGYKKLLEDIGHGQIQLVAFTRLDRMFRNMHDFLTFADLAKAHKCEMLCLDMSLDTSTASGKLQALVLASHLAEFERDQISEREAPRRNPERK